MKRRWISGGLASSVLIGACWLVICSFHGAPAHEQHGPSPAKHRDGKNPFAGKVVEVSLATEQPSTPDVDGLWEQVRFEKLHGRTFLVGRVVGTDVERFVDWNSVQDFCVFDSRAQHDEFLRSRLDRAFEGVRAVLGNPSDNPEIRTIRVPAIDLGDRRRVLGEWLTEAVIKEIENVTPFKVSQAPDADSVLTCTLETAAQQSDLESPNKNLGEKTDGVLKVRWTDEQGAELRPAILLPLPTIAAAPDVLPATRQSLSADDQRRIHTLARQIVDFLEGSR